MAKDKLQKIDSLKKELDALRPLKSEQLKNITILRYIVDKNRCKKEKYHEKGWTYLCANDYGSGITFVWRNCHGLCLWG